METVKQTVKQTAKQTGNTPETTTDQNAPVKSAIELARERVKSLTHAKLDKQQSSSLTENYRKFVASGQMDEAEKLIDSITDESILNQLFEDIESRGLTPKTHRKRGINRERFPELWQYPDGTQFHSIDTIDALPKLRAYMVLKNLTKLTINESAMYEEFAVPTKYESVKQRAKRHQFILKYGFLPHSLSVLGATEIRKNLPINAITTKMLTDNGLRMELYRESGKLKSRTFYIIETPVRDTGKSKNK